MKKFQQKQFKFKTKSMNKGTAENKQICLWTEFLFMRSWNKYRDTFNQTLNHSLTPDAKFK